MRELGDTGRKLLQIFPNGFTEKHLLEKTPGYQTVDGAQGETAPKSVEVTQAGALNPREQIAAGVDRLQADVATDLLRRLRSVDPAFFETTVLTLLVAMGYGGADEHRARRIGGSGDGGVDGVIDQDPLGLGRIYVQAKRYASDNVVGRPQIQGFVGAMASRPIKGYSSRRVASPRRRPNTPAKSTHRSFSSTARDRRG